MADLPTHHEIEEAIREGDNYEHPEPHAPAGGCSNLGEIPHDIATTEDTED
ncbi:MAG TPA: hypothetical protein VIG82_05650 [Enteractinococcus sp.]